MAALSRKFIDIGANLADEMYQGIYNGIRKHIPDLDQVIQRSWDSELDKIIITGTSLSEAATAIEIANSNSNLYATVGCHPTRCDEFELADGGPESHMNNFLKLINDNKEKVVAVGECGLDYDRLHFCPAERQKKYFKKQIILSQRANLPMFLHCRNAVDDLVAIIIPHRKDIPGGVVHSYDGTESGMKMILEQNLYIGINGCSLKTNENLEVASKIPLSHLMVETDSPWCEIRPSHSGYKHIKTFFSTKKKEKWDAASLVKSRNEPCNIIQVLEVLSAIRGETIEEIASATYRNSCNLFFRSQGK